MVQISQGLLAYFSDKKTQAAVDLLLAKKRLAPGHWIRTGDERSLDIEYAARRGHYGRSRGKLVKNGVDGLRKCVHPVKPVVDEWAGLRLATPPVMADADMVISDRIGADKRMACGGGPPKS